MKGFLGLINFTLVVVFILHRKVGYLDETERNKINIVDLYERKNWVLCYALIFFFFFSLWLVNQVKLLNVICVTLSGSIILIEMSEPSYPMSCNMNNGKRHEEMLKKKNFLVCIICLSRGLV